MTGAWILQAHAHTALNPAQLLLPCYRTMLECRAFVTTSAPVVFQ